MLFASLLVAVCVIFSIMAYHYTYIDPAEIEAQFLQNAEFEPEDKDEKSKSINMENKKTVINEDDSVKMTKI